VLIELANFFAAPSRREALPRLLDAISSSPTTSLVPCSPRLFKSGLALFRSRPDKAWSLTDCTSFVVMRKRRIRDALTADQHFEQAGFRALLRK
jgi:predicted nucleic acid-binding protein